MSKSRFSWLKKGVRKLSSPFKVISNINTVLRISKRNILLSVCLLFVILIAILIRIQPISWGFYLSEFDPYFHYSIAERIVEDGIEVYNSYHSQLEGFQKDYYWCPYIQILPIIGADQNVYACHDKAYNKDTGMLGSIKDKRFKDF